MSRLGGKLTVRTGDHSHRLKWQILEVVEAAQYWARGFGAEERGGGVGEMVVVVCRSWKG